MTRLQGKTRSEIQLFNPEHHISVTLLLKPLKPLLPVWFGTDECTNPDLGSGAASECPWCCPSRSVQTICSKMLENAHMLENPVELDCPGCVGSREILGSQVLFMPGKVNVCSVKELVETPS